MMSLLHAAVTPWAMLPTMLTHAFCALHTVPCFKQGPFDVITCSSALLYLPDVPAALRLFRSWLRPGGRLIFNTPKVEPPRTERSGVFHLKISTRTSHSSR